MSISSKTKRPKMSISSKTKRPQKQLSYKSIRPEMLLSIKNECLLVREVYQNHLSKKVVLVSKNSRDKKV